MRRDQQRSVALLPWVRLKEEVRAGDVRFVPFQARKPCPELGDAGAAFGKTLGVYCDLEGRSREECTLAVPEGWGPRDDLDDRRLADISTAVTILFLGALSENEYGTQGRRYVNSTAFRLYFQRFVIGEDRIAFRIRRIDGSTLSAGWEISKTRITVPLEAQHVSLPVSVDVPFAQALQEARAAGSPAAKRTLGALEFLRLATTDSEAVSSEAETIATASALETLVGADGKAGAVATKVAKLLHAYGQVRVRCATKRTGIVLGIGYDQRRHQWRCEPKHANTQSAWFLHQKWAEELHHLRSVYVHGEDPCQRTWGWEPREHLVMGAFVFPLVVKVLLANEGHYALTPSDEDRCYAVDKLLAATGWFAGADSWSRPWREILRQVAWQRVVERAAKVAEQKLKEA